MGERQAAEIAGSVLENGDSGWAAGDCDGHLWKDEEVELGGDRGLFGGCEEGASRSKYSYLLAVSYYYGSETFEVSDSNMASRRGKEVGKELGENRKTAFYVSKAQSKQKLNLDRVFELQPLSKPQKTAMEDPISVYLRVGGWPSYYVSGDHHPRLTPTTSC